MIEDEGSGVGDVISTALALVGITEQRVSALIGAPCGCSGRQEKLNQLGRWAARVVRGKVAGAVSYFEEIVQDWSPR